jgi:hypothetical protein
MEHTPSEEILELNPGCAGKGEVLTRAILHVIDEEQYQDMTVMEILGALELVKLDLARALGRI